LSKSKFEYSWKAKFLLETFVTHVVTASKPDGLFRVVVVRIGCLAVGLPTKVAFAVVLFDFLNRYWV
jgi:hypothetical protein